jgi:hypothetical protein
MYLCDCNWFHDNLMKLASSTCPLDCVIYKNVYIYIYLKKKKFKSIITHAHQQVISSYEVLLLTKEEEDWYMYVGVFTQTLRRDISVKKIKWEIWIWLHLFHDVIKYNDDSHFIHIRIIRCQIFNIFI